MSNSEEALFKKLLENYLAGDVDLSGVAVMVNETEQRIEMLTFNSTSTEAFILLLHGLQAMHDKALSTTGFNKTLQ